MSSLTDGWHRLPAVARWPIGFVLVIGVYAIGYVAIAAAFGLDSDRDDMTIRLALLPFAAVLFGIGLLDQRRRLGGKGQLSLYRKAYRTGVVPEGARVDRWRRVVRRQARYFREGRRVYLGLYAIFIAVLVVVAVLGTVLHGPTWLWFLALAAVTSLIAWGTDRLWLWRRRQFERLEQALASSG
ncbi:hypothetical protein [Aeromicrobium sp. NPDC092404]|uniref:hypothetical protein n=1 Tax=Aeromicrobium sp. NPDC092404 TaxID=3154976 RepID=UPI0034136AF7